LVTVDVFILADTSTVVNMWRWNPVAKANLAVSNDRAACCSPLLAEPLAEADARELAHAFAALADPVRLRLLSLVAAAGEVCSCDLERPLGKSQPTISHHTKALADAGLIVGEKRGRWMWWSIAPERIANLRAVLS
jgi:ArsR family transcriptional regulator, arsenate/arsenite/antimonite-responsive transcriptional repressor